MKKSLYGIIPGLVSGDNKYIKTCSEFELYIQVEKYRELAINFFKTNNQKLDECLYALDYCVLETSRFNTNTEYNPEGRVIITEEFNIWYNNWKNYVENMDDETLMALRRCQKQALPLNIFYFDKPVNEAEIEQFEINPKVYTKKQQNIRSVSA